MFISMAEGSLPRGIFRRALQFTGLGRVFMSSMLLFSNGERN